MILGSGGNTRCPKLLHRCVRMSPSAAPVHKKSQELVSEAIASRLPHKAKKTPHKASAQSQRTKPHKATEATL